MEDPPPPESSYGIDSDDEDTPLAEQPPEEAERQADILSSYKEYLSEIQEELPPGASAAAAAEGLISEDDIEGGPRPPMDPDEETTGDGTLDPPEENIPLNNPRRGPFRRFRDARRKKRTNQTYHEQDDELDEMYQELGVSPPSSRGHPSYTHPLLHILTRRQCLFVSSVLIVVIGLSIGLSWNPSGAIELLTEEEDKLHNMLHPPSYKSDGSEVLTEAQWESEEYRKVTELYMPTWYDRAEGWEGQSYDEGILFCAGLGRILCPYEGMCVSFFY